MGEVQEFTATPDMVDSLKLEASMLTPSQDAYFKKQAKLLSQDFLSRYRELIPQKTLRRTQHPENRFVITPSKEFKQLYGEWDSTTRNQGEKPDKGIHGVYFPEGRFVGLDNPLTVWEGEFSEKTKQKLSKQIGGRRKARQEVANVSVYEFLTHELIHQYQDNSLPATFLEVAVPYYARETLKHLGFGHLVNPTYNKRVSFYENIVNDYGPDAHKLFFGSLSSSSNMRNAILGRFTPEVTNKLFPPNI
jgi:hypothetical protein